MKWTAFLILCIWWTTGLGQSSWKQEVNYTMDAALEDEAKTLAVRQSIQYHNNSPHSLDTLFIHLWANAFGDKRSAYFKQTVEFGFLQPYFDPGNKEAGFKDVELSIGGKALDLIPYQGKCDVFFLLLEAPLESGKSLEVNMGYTLHIPKKFSRLGYAENTIHLAHWYPRLAAFDEEGWHPMEYLGAGEFYGDYGSFTIQLNIPGEFKIICPFLSDVKQEAGRSIYSIEGAKVHDMALFLHKTHEVEQRSITLGDRKIQLEIMRDPDSEFWQKGMDYFEDALRYFDEHVGPYPYQTAALIQSDLIDLGNMEYPAIATIAAATDASLEYYIAHEVGHFWFQGVLGFNERDHAWMDEGLTTYYEHRFTKDRHGKAYYDRVLNPSIAKAFQRPFIETVVANQVCRHAHQPMSTPIEDYGRANYGINNYERAAMVFRYLADYLGQDTFDRAIQYLYRLYSYDHPGPSDLQRILEEASGKNLEFLFKEYIQEGKSIDYSLRKEKKNRLILEQKGEILAPVWIRKVLEDDTFEDEWLLPKKSQTVIRVPRKVVEVILDPEARSLDFKRTNNYSKRGIPKIRWGRPVLGSYRENDLNVLPLLSYNANDGIGLGALATNTTYPTKNLKYAIAPQFSISSNSITGQAWTSLTQYKKGDLWHKWVYRLGLKSFHMDHSETLDVERRYIRLDPSATFFFRSGPGSRRTTYIKADYIRLWEDFSQFNGGEFDGFRQLGSHIIRLGLYSKDEGFLNQRSYNLVFEQARHESVFNSDNKYFKVSADYIQSYKYSAKHGIKLRLHGAAFITNSQSDRSANVNDKGVLSLFYQGFNDYAYDGYYLARFNQNTSLDNQVSVENGGGFKQAFGAARASTIGQSQRYLMAANLWVDIPLDLGVFKAKAYFDYGIYGQHILAQPPENEARTLYSGGLALEAFGGMLGFYLPLINHSSINDIYEQEDSGILGRITFSLNLHQYDPWKLLDDKKL